MTNAWRIVAISAGVVLLIALAGVALWLLNRERAYQAREPLRHAVTIAKSGDTAQAIPVLEEFARKGDAPTRLLLAELYAYGLGVRYDERRAAIWARAASERGLNDGGSFEYGVALAYLSGKQSAADPNRALSWCVRAAEAGNQEAQKALANGTGPAAAAGSLDAETSAYWKAFLSNKPAESTTR